MQDVTKHHRRSVRRRRPAVAVGKRKARDRHAAVVAESTTAVGTKAEGVAAEGVPAEGAAAEEVAAEGAAAEGVAIAKFESA